MTEYSNTSKSNVGAICGALLLIASVNLLACAGALIWLIRVQNRMIHEVFEDLTR